MSKVKFDGYYYHIDFKENDKYNSYNYILRFFPNNRVIGVTVDVTKENKFTFGNCFPVGNWFNENYESNGIFNISENQITFECGDIEYKGTIINDDILKLFSHSNINNYETTEEYNFISFKVLQDIRTSEKL